MTELAVSASSPPPSASSTSGSSEWRLQGGYLGDTPAVARASYIDPRIIDLYEDGRTIAPALGKLGVDAAEGELATQGPVEQAVLDLLRDAD